MIEDIKQIIEKNLPAEVGKVLQERLQKTDQFERDLQASKEREFQLTKVITELKGSNEEYKKNDERNRNLDVREKSIFEREQILEKTILEIKLKEAEERFKVSERLVEKVFANSIMKSSMWGSIPLAVPGGAGYSGMVQQGNISQETTIKNEPE